MLATKFGILFPVLLAAGCAWDGPVRSLTTATNNPAIVERNVDGTAIMRSSRTHLVSVLSRSDKFSNDTFTLPTLYVIVTNGGKEKIALGPSNISAYSGDRRVALLDPLAMQERLDLAQAATGSDGRFPVGMKDASQPAEIRHRHRHQSSIGPAAEPFSALNFKVPARIVEQSLEPQVIQPFDTGGGRIVLESQDILSGLPLKVVVNVAGEKHEFLFEVQY